MSETMGTTRQVELLSTSPTPVLALKVYNYGHGTTRLLNER
jgi:hypothetical protein